MTEKPKLLITVDTYYPKIDGTLRFVEEFVKRAGDIFDYHIIAPGFKKKKEERVTLLEVSKFIKSSGYESIKFSLKNLKKIKEAVKNCDLVFIQGPALISFFAGFYAKRYKKPSIGYMHINIWEFFKKFLVTLPSKILYWSLLPFVRMWLNKMSLILIPYEGLKSKLKKRGIKVPIKVAHLGIDIDKFYPTKNKKESKKKVGLDPNRKIIGYVGRISYEKNLKTLLEAFNKLHEDNVQLLIVGDGSPEIIKELKANKKCKVTGFVKNPEDYLKAMDIFVMPSLTETASLATLEAMSAGLPVIVTKVGYMKKYIIKDHNGMFFPKNSSTMLAIKLEKLLNDDILRENLAFHARKTVAYSFSLERSINKIKRLLLKAYRV